MHNIDFSTRHLRYFVCTAELGQISQAAKQLNITQSAITSAIKELESRLQTQLFYRRPDGVLLTYSGSAFLGHCYQILSSVADCYHLSSVQTELIADINVAATYTVMGYFLPAHLHRLNQLYPNLRIHLKEMSRVEIEAGLISGELDAALLLSSNVSNPKLHVQSLIESKRNLWVGQGHKLLEKTSVDFDDLINEPYIMLTVDEAKNTALAYWQKEGIKPKTIVQTSSIEAVRSMVANGSGISILSDTVYRPWSLEGRKINKIRLKTKVPPMSLGIAWLAKSKLRPEQNAFINYFIN